MKPPPLPSSTHGDALTSATFLKPSCTPQHSVTHETIIERHHSGTRQHPCSRVCLSSAVRLSCMFACIPNLVSNGLTQGPVSRRDLFLVAGTAAGLAGFKLWKRDDDSSNEPEIGNRAGEALTGPAPGATSWMGLDGRQLKTCILSCHSTPGTMGKFLLEMLYIAIYWLEPEIARRGCRVWMLQCCRCPASANQIACAQCVAETGRSNLKGNAVVSLRQLPGLFSISGHV